MFTLKNVVKKFCRHHETITAVNCNYLSIKSGEYVAIVGPSGSGKTTLLSLLGGMLSPDDGEVMLNDVSIYNLSIAERSKLRSLKMGFVFQTFNLIPYLSALENVQIPLCLSGVKRQEQEEKATELLEYFGLAARLHHKPSQLSIGQQQRVALARTLVNKPEIILADEPTGNLDMESREIVLTAFDQAKAEGKTIVMVTHDPVAASRASRVLTLQNSVLSESDTNIQSPASLHLRSA